MYNDVTLHYMALWTFVCGAALVWVVMHLRRNAHFRKSVCDCRVLDSRLKNILQHSRETIYSFDLSGDFTLGVQPSGTDFTSGTFEIKTTNTTLNRIANFTISYKGHVYNNENRSSFINFSYSTDGTTFIPIHSLDYNTLETAGVSPQWGTKLQTTDFAVDVPAGGNLYLRYSSDDASGSGSRDEFSLNDIILKETN